MRLIVLIPSALALGCFEYRQIPLTTAPIGKDVRINLTEDGHTRLVQSVGNDMPRVGQTFNGTLISRNDQWLLVGVESWAGRPGTREGLQQRITVPVSDVLGLQKKLLDNKKTTIVAVSTGAAVIAFIAYYVRGEFGGTTSPFPEPGPGESVQIPFRFFR